MKPGRRPYFAYGSNIVPRTMMRRCPQAKLIGTGRLLGHRFAITSDGVATVLPDPQSTVHGVLWRLSLADEQALDLIEGVAIGCYRRELVDVTPSSLQPVASLLYVSQSFAAGSPRLGYLEPVIVAAHTHRMPSNYVAELMAWRRR